MSAVRFAPLIAVILLVLQSYAAAADFSFPPLFGNACSGNVCGKGKCVVSTNSSSTFGFECECEAGWSQTRSNDDKNFKFLPCVIPNCTRNSSCATAPAPPPSDQNRNTSLIFDPCHWADCGGGSCNKTSPFTRTCLCEQGYYNLLNSTYLPCYRECEFGLDCAKLGINIMSPPNPSPPPSSNMADNSRSDGTTLIPRMEFSWSIIMATTLAMVGLKYS